ncbi:hypothetical protein PV11_04199 [Exophiala sideris]|uniref:HAUS augmin-like complex subunit 1 n=1 Tax=Exophiala sideris TaxID=1016849 RepID=A0A0D1Z5D1_9EURO|nr:hypothetical protein PV11_04199 [Exophiala sideris]
MSLMLPNVSDFYDLSTQASPSKARAEAFEVHSWTLVLTWLSALYHPSPAPSFERNATTLKALQSLMAENVAADRLRDLLFRAQLEELNASQDCSSIPTDTSPDSLLYLLGSSLPHTANSALESLAGSAVLLGCPTSNTNESILDNLSTQIPKIPRDIFELEMQLSSIKGLVSDLRTETVQLQPLVVSHPDDHQPDHDESASDLEVHPSTPHTSTSSTINYSHLHAQTLQHQRETKQLTLKCAEYESRITALERQAASRPVNGPSLAGLATKQQAIDAKKKRVEALEKAIRVFNGLPPDVHASRAEVQRAQAELDIFTGTRDELFPSLGG